MKKLMVMIAALSLAAAVSANDRTVAELIEQSSAIKTNKNDAAEVMAFVGGFTRNEWSALFDHMLSVASTNVDAAETMLLHSMLPNRAGALWYARLRGECRVGREVAAEYDQRLAAAGLYAWLNTYDFTPALCEEWITRTRADETTPATVAALRRNKTPYTWKWSIAEQLNKFSEDMAAGRLRDINGAKMTMLGSATIPIRRALRESGLTFVIKEDGINPVQAVLDELQVALNAPKLEGLKRWTVKWFPNYTWIDSAWKSDEEIAALRNKVYYGEAELSPYAQCILLGYYGVDEYNKFIADYNGTASEK